jgi:hypothetical protein
MLGVSGIGQVKYERYGEAFLSVLKAAAAPVPERRQLYSREREAPDGTRLTPSLRETLSLYQDGIREHPDDGEGSGACAEHDRDACRTAPGSGRDPDLDGLVAPEKVDLVQRTLNGRPIGGIAPLKEELGMR